MVRHSESTDKEYLQKAIEILKIVKKNGIRPFKPSVMFLFDSSQLCIWEEEPVTWGDFKFLLASVVHTGFWQDPPTFRLDDIDERIEQYRDVQFFKNMTPVRVLSRPQIYGGGSIPAVSYGPENIVYCGHYTDRWIPSHSYPMISRLLELAHVELSPMRSTFLDEELKRRKNTTWEFLFQRNTFFTARMSGMRWICRD